MKKIVLSGFDGIACGMIGLKRAGITPDIYLASEINEDAIGIAMYHFPDIVQLGTIEKIKIQTIYLSEAYNYLCKKYFNGNIQSLQSIISEREMLHRINKKETFSAYWGTQEQRKIGKTQSNTSLSINDRIWFWKNPMGDFKGLYDVIRGGDRREIPDTLNVGKLCKHSFWWNGDGQYEPRTEETSFKGFDGESCNRKIEGKDSKNIERIFLNTRHERTSTNKSSGTISRSDKKTELFGCNIKTRSSSNGNEKKENRGDQETGNVSDIKEQLQTAYEHERTININRNISNLYKKTQITVVECEWGLIIFKDKIQLTIAGSPCQSFSNAGRREGFDGKSKLFFDWLGLKEEIQPEYWLLENVASMKKEWRNIISRCLGSQPYPINSMVTSGQSRPRLYWTSIPYTEIQDKGILLGDEVLGAVRGAGKHGRKIPKHLKVHGGFTWKVADFEFNPDNKGYCITTNGGKYQNTQGEIKNFTVENCEALQKIPIGYTGVTGLCNSKRIEAIGNAWTVDVLTEAFFKNLPWANEKKMSLRLKYLNHEHKEE